jgi:hypothetical protein
LGEKDGAGAIHDLAALGAFGLFGRACGSKGHLRTCVILTEPFGQCVTGHWKQLICRTAEAPRQEPKKRNQRRRETRRPLRLKHVGQQLQSHGSVAKATALKQLMQITHTQGLVMAFADVFFLLMLLFAVIIKKPPGLHGA